jgi:transposase
MAKRTGRKVTPATDVRVERLIEALKAGNYLEHACDYAGIGKSTVYRWLDRGQQEAENIEQGLKPDRHEKQYVELWDAIKRARSEATVRNVALIQQAARNGTWQAAAWWLERTAPQQYGRSVRAEVTGENGEPIKVSVTVNALEAKIAALIGEIDESSDSEIIDATE